VTHFQHQRQSGLDGPSCIARHYKCAFCCCCHLSAVRPCVCGQAGARSCVCGPEALTRDYPGRRCAALFTAFHMSDTDMRAHQI
jgi:hypothetical protein